LEKGKITFMKIVKRIFLGLLVGVAFMGIGFVVWAESPLKATAEAFSALESDSQITVTAGDYITFQPANLQPTTGFIFYPGGRVDYRAYAPVLRIIAEQGYFVALVPVTLNLAFFDINAAEPVLAQHPEIKYWVVSGHSLGGVAASLFAKDHLDQLDGLVFFASYPADDSLKNADIKVLSIYGTRDMAGMAKFDETKTLMPANTKYVVMDGGNHAQFGSYGFQPGDNAATISAEEQWSQITAATVEFLNGLEQ
jgi:dienelactone hydrolase